MMAQLQRQCLSRRAVSAQAASTLQPIARRNLLGAAGFASVSLALLKPAAAGAGADFVTAPNGLQYRDDVIGSGEAPVKGAKIKCHYTGRLKSNGVKFDSSYDRGSPLAFTIGVGQVIRGWDIGILGSEAEGIPPMREGGKRTLVIPADLGYGARGAGGVIPPNAVLEFDVELVARK